MVLGIRGCENNDNVRKDKAKFNVRRFKNKLVDVQRDTKRIVSLRVW